MQNVSIVPVILAGGSGSGLWPVSRESLPKQFARLADGPTMFQQTVLRVADKAVFDPPVIVANARHAATIRQQLAQIGCDRAHILCEPEGRDTAAAIALAAGLQIGRPESAILAMPCDHVINDAGAFLRLLPSGLRMARRRASIVAFGIRPTHPEPAYAYLRAGQPVAGESGFMLEEFVEKPGLARSVELVRTPGNYWNSGIFLFDRSVALAEFREHAERTLTLVDASIDSGVWEGNCFHPQADMFCAIEPASFDAAIMQRTARSSILPAEIGWADIGTWKAVWENRERDVNENALSGPVWCIDSRNSLIASDGPAVAVAGLDDVVVVASRDAVLVTSRSNPQDVGRIVETLRAEGVSAATSHDSVSRPWGHFENIEHGEHHRVKHVTVEPGNALSLHYHHHRVEHWILVRGLATVTVENRVMALGPCQQVFIPQGARHRLENLTDEPVEIIEIQYGDYLGDDDVVRVEDDYGRIGEAKPARAA